MLAGGMLPETGSSEPLRTERWPSGVVAVNAISIQFSYLNPVMPGIDIPHVVTITKIVYRTCIEVPIEIVIPSLL